MTEKMTIVKMTKEFGKVPFIYLDNASTTFPKPECVYKFMNSFYRQYGVNPGRAKGYAYQQAEIILSRTRSRLTRFFNSRNHNRLVFTYNATDALNMIISGILKNGDHVVTTNLEHNAVIRPLNHLALKINIEVDWVSCDRYGFIDPDDIKKRIKKNTKLVIVNHCSNVIGTIQPVTDIGKICGKAGVIFAIDAAQTAGVIPIDMEKSNIDVIAFTGHKSLLGPMGIGGLQIKNRINIEPIRFGGTGILSEKKYQPEQFPYYLECGTLNMVGVAGLFAAQDYLDEKGVSNIYRHEMKLAKMLYQGLRPIKKIILYNKPVMGTHIGMISFGIKGITPEKIGSILESKYGIYSRAGLHCAPLIHKHIGTITGGTVRLSIGPFNTATEIEKTILAISEIASQRQ